MFQSFPRWRCHTHEFSSCRPLTCVSVLPVCLMSCGYPMRWRWKSCSSGNTCWHEQVRRKGSLASTQRSTLSTECQQSGSSPNTTTTKNNCECLFMAIMSTAISTHQSARHTPVMCSFMGGNKNSHGPDLLGGKCFVFLMGGSKPALTQYSPPPDCCHSYNCKYFDTCLQVY